MGGATTESPILANILISHHKKNWFNECSMEFKSTF